jgi:hypothetical protein
MSLDKWLTIILIGGILLYSFGLSKKWWTWPPSILRASSWRSPFSGWVSPTPVNPPADRTLVINWRWVAAIIAIIGICIAVFLFRAEIDTALPGTVSGQHFWTGAWAATTAAAASVQAAFLSASWVTLLLLAALLFALAFVLRNTRFQGAVRRGLTAAAWVLIAWVVLIPIVSAVEWYNSPPKRTVTAYSNPEVFRDAVAKKRSTPECPGTVKVLDASNPYYKLRGERCMFYYRVLKGTFRVDGTNGWGNKAEPLIMSPNGGATTHNKQFYAREARLLTGDGEMQILECPTSSVQRNWQCWDR